ncbi:hypothetical protein TBR22_A05450 [Luteitalea sp. TBR-22]|uniref:hypothetical protein n=1 Tax=Luteitalea sp. TBR-22 TaxID=2802971 RepID=UPI001AF713A4|nr:hypothetical protein [Luteitalea sp. TBR-22]BCS31345.1 hypothetical protein TBR22_A05450 [Luteitalea sp. TBR-22]
MSTRIGVACRDERGASMIFTLLSLTMVTVLGLGLTSVALSTVSQATAESQTTEALAIADAGIEHGKQLVLWQDWESLNVFLQRGDGAGCSYDELAGTPAGTLPAGYPTQAADFIPAAGRVFGPGRYFVELCDNHSREQVAPAPNTNNDPNVDVDKVLYMRSVGFGGNGARAAVELTLGAAAMPAVVVDGNLEVKGNPTVTGPAGSIHANGTLLLSGNPCTHVYYASTAGTTESGNVQGGTACTAADVDSRPYSPRMNIPRLDPYRVAQQAKAAGFTVYTLIPKGYNDGFVSCVSNNGCAYTGLPAGPGYANSLVALGAIPAGWDYNNNGQLWRTQGVTQAGTYYVIGNAQETANTSGAAGAEVNLTVIAQGSIEANGNPNVRPHSTVPFIGPILMIAGHDLDLGATFDSSYNGLFYARHQLDIKGSPTLNGQVIALNEADTDYASKNPVTRQSGVMVIAGNPTINYTGNGLNSVRALTWRECRGQWQGTVMAGGAITNPGNSCGAP